MNEQRTTQMRVVMVIENLMGGGAQIFALRLADALRVKGVDVKVVLLFHHLENKKLTGLFPHVPVIGLHILLLKFWAFIDRWLFRLRQDLSFVEFFQSKQLHKHFRDATVVHTHYIKTDYYVSKLLRKHQNTRHVVTVHGDYSHQYNHYKKHGRAIWNNFENKLQRLKTAVNKWIVIAEEQRFFFEDTLEFPPKRIKKIYNGFAAQSTEEDSAKSDHGEFVIGMLARGVEEKGWEILIKSFLRLPMNCRLLLGGDSTYLQTLAEKYRTETRITFAGHQQDAVAFIQRCHVVALPSHAKTESLPYSLIEALACAKPAIASNVGEIKEMLTAKNGELAGVVLPLVNGQVAEHDLYNALLRFANDESYLQHKASLAKEVFMKFEMETCVNSYLEVYKGE